MSDPRPRAAKIILEELREYPELQITEADLWWTEDDKIIYPIGDNNFVKGLLSLLAPVIPFTTKLYHYIPLEHGMFALWNKCIRMYFLEKYFAEDPDEYSGLLDGLNIPEEVTFGGEKYSRSTEEVRRNSYIFSTTDSSDNEFLWSKSTEGAAQICLEVQIEPLPDSHLPEILRDLSFFELRKVNYERRIECLNRIYDRIQRALGYKFVFSGIIHLALHTKGEEFIPEREHRFGVNDYYLQNLGRSLSTPELAAFGAGPSSDQPGLVHVSFPLIGLEEDRHEYPDDDIRTHLKKRYLFTFRLSKIIVDENISREELAKLRAYAERFDPSVPIEKRK